MGRETHTFVNYIVRTYSELPDITVFINGGFTAKHHTLLALKRIARALDVTFLVVSKRDEFTLTEMFSRPFSMKKLRQPKQNLCPYCFRVL